jgi:hypothetical protein
VIIAQGEQGSDRGSFDGAIQPVPERERPAPSTDAAATSPAADPNLCKVPGKAIRPAQQGSVNDSGPAQAIAAVRPLSAGKGEAVSEPAPSVGGSAATGQALVAGAVAEAFAAQFIRRVLSATRDLDPLELQAQLDLAVGDLGLARCVDEIVIPLTQGLRGLLGTGQRDAAQQLMATEAIRTWLNHRGSFAPPPRETGPILLACGPRDRDTVGLESLGLLLRFERYPCRVLGARVSKFNLTIAAQAARAAGVVIICTESRGLSHAVAALLAVDALGIPVFFAGNAFEPEHARRRLPGLYLGTRTGVASTQLVETLAPAVSASAGRRCRGSGRSCQ